MTLVSAATVAMAAGCALSAAMAAAWVVQQKTAKSGRVDAVWSFAVGVTGVVLALGPIDRGGPLWRQVLVAVLAAGWSLRLGLHITDRNRDSGDDPRYRKLIEQWGSDAPRRMFVFLQSQAAVGVILVFAIMLAAHFPDPGLRMRDLLGAAIVLTGIAGEAIADRQLRTFAKNPANRNLVCNVGLWRYSRHPNYFFEWVVWVAYPVIAIGFDNPLSWLSLGAPAAMYWVLVHVSGIPPLEEHMLRTRGQTFRKYQEQTSPFVPLPRRG